MLQFLRTKFHCISTITFFRNVTLTSVRQNKTNGLREVLSHRKTFHNLIVGAVLATKLSSPEKDVEACDTKQIKLKDLDRCSLTHSHLIENAASMAAQSASTLLSQVVHTIADKEKEYVTAVKRLCDLKEYGLDNDVTDDMEHKLQDVIIEVRAVINDIRNQKQELDILYSSVKKLVDASSEAAYIAGAEFISNNASEQLHNADVYIKQMRERSQQTELELAKIEADIIRSTENHNVDNSDSGTL